MEPLTPPSVLPVERLIEPLSLLPPAPLVKVIEPPVTEPAPALIETSPPSVVVDSPAVMVIEPPSPPAPVVFPATMVMERPEPVSPSPTDTSMSPPLPPVAAPVEIERSPLGPPVATPEARLTSPLMVWPEPEARLRAPPSDCTDWPAVMDTLPPFASGPLCACLPARMVTSPDAFALEFPESATSMEILPPFPVAVAPDWIVISPLSPDPAEPEDIEMGPPFTAPWPPVKDIAPLSVTVESPEVKAIDPPFCP
mmetsp:Transcript_39786/g.102471  ORF Transcript_39786/g.102471 Transcript_39786/m.102471 type:complete len:254 (+) Transcript_39786:166-927(+)